MRYAINHYRQKMPVWENPAYTEYDNPEIIKLHQSIPEYKPSPLMALPDLAHSVGLGNIYVKDESQRLGLKAFKAMGASYAVYRYIKKHLSEQSKTVPEAPDFYSSTDILAPGQFTLTTATDGNHGRAVAWVARKLKQRAVIYMPDDSAEARFKNIQSEDAEVVLVKGSYDDAVNKCRADAGLHNRQIISDTAWENYHEIPNWIVAGYTTLFKEIDAVLAHNQHIDLVILPAGVGSLAASAIWYYNTIHSDKIIKLVIVEPELAACLMWSLVENKGNSGCMPDQPESIMAGLCCGTPSPGAWPIIKDGADLFVTVADRDARQAMRTYYNPLGNDPQIISGESGAAGLAALQQICRQDSNSEIADFLNLNSNSSILLLNTEGDTDPVNYKRIIDSDG